MARRIITDILIVILIGVILVAGWKLLSYWQDGRTSNQIQQNAINAVVKPLPSIPEESEPPVPEGETSAAEETHPFRGYAPISVDFEALRHLNRDAVAWIYNPDTKIHYPIVQTEDNAYYLHRGLDGSDNGPGTLFMDYRNLPNFSNKNTIIYGHNMRNYTMFGTLTEYNSQDYYDEHPIMYIMTPDTDFKLELVAGALISEKNDMYNYSKPERDIVDAIMECIEDSTFETDVVVRPDDRFVTLSTCSYEFSGARYVVIGVLHELDRRPQI